MVLFRLRRQSTEPKDWTDYVLVKSRLTLNHDVSRKHTIPKSY